MPLLTTTSASPRSAPQWLRAMLGILVSILSLGGCADYSGLPEPEPGTYAGPPIVGEIQHGEHLLVATLPTPGYEFTLDGTREAFQAQEIFVTLRKPNPGVLYSQVEVQQRLASGVPSRTAVRVYARVLEFGEKADGGHMLALTLAAIPAEKPTGRPGSR